MKSFLLAFALIFVGAFAQAQSGSVFFHTGSDTNDTLGAYTTYTYDFNTLEFSGQNVSKPWSYSITVEADSLSGAAADSSTVFLQIADASVTESNPVWVTIDSDEIDGTATQIFHYTGDLIAPRMRLVIWSQSGTKAILLRSFWSFKLKSKA